MDGIFTTEVQNYITLAAAVLLAISAILWFFLPFAVFGIKNRLDRQAVITSDVLSELQHLRAEMRAVRSYPAERHDVP